LYTSSPISAKGGIHLSAVLVQTACLDFTSRTPSGVTMGELAAGYLTHDQMASVQASWLAATFRLQSLREPPARGHLTRFGFSRGHLTPFRAGHLTPRKTEDARTRHGPGLSTNLG
jgi:hypothetical protein